MRDLCVLIVLEVVKGELRASATSTPPLGERGGVCLLVRTTRGSRGQFEGVRDSRGPVRVPNKTVNLRTGFCRFFSYFLP